MQKEPGNRRAFFAYGNGNIKIVYPINAAILIDIIQERHKTCSYGKEWTLL